MNQKSRLEQLLQENWFRDGNKLIVQEKNTQDLSENTKKDLAQASNIVEYLNRSFGTESLWYLYANSATWFQELLYNNNDWNNSQMFIRKLWITWELPWIYDRDTLGESRWESFNIYRQIPTVDILSVENYQYIIKLSWYEWQPQENAQSNQSQNNITVTTNSDRKTLITVLSEDNRFIIDLNLLGSQIYNLSKKELKIKDYQLDYDWYSILLNSIDWERKWDTYKIVWYDITILINKL